jgi:hypothetical protein
MGHRPAPAGGHLAQGGTLLAGKGTGVIDIVKDYVAIGTGSAQATTSRIIGVGRASVDRVASVVDRDWRALGSHLDALSPGALVDHGRDLAKGVLKGDVDDVVGRLGLVKRSELNSVREHVHRLERRLGEVRGER